MIIIFIISNQYDLIDDHLKKKKTRQLIKLIYTRRIYIYKWGNKNVHGVSLNHVVVDFNLEEYLWGKCMGPTNMLRYMEFGGGMETCVQATELFIGNELLLPHLVSYHCKCSSFYGTFPPLFRWNMNFFVFTKRSSTNIKHLKLIQKPQFSFLPIAIRVNAWTSLYIFFHFYSQFVNVYVS